MLNNTSGIKLSAFLPIQFTEEALGSSGIALSVFIKLFLMLFSIGCVSW